MRINRLSMLAICLLAMAGTALAGNVVGYKFNDSDADGNWDAGEGVLSGWQIRLQLIGGGTIYTTSTNPSGYYSFNNRAAGTYFIWERFPVDEPWVNTTNARRIIIINSSGTTLVNFSNIKALIWIGMLRTQLNQTLADLNRTQEELNQTLIELNQTQDELNQTKEELNQTKEELNQTLIKLESIQNQLNWVISVLNQTQEELNQTSDALNQTLVELGQAQSQFWSALDQLNQTNYQLNQTLDLMFLLESNLSIANSQLNVTSDELNRTRDELNSVKAQLDWEKSKPTGYSYSCIDEERALKAEINAHNITRNELNMTKELLLKTQMELDSLAKANAYLEYPINKSQTTATKFSWFENLIQFIREIFIKNESK